MSSLISFNHRNSKFQSNRKANFSAIFFNSLIVVNALTGFFLVLTSFRQLAMHTASLDFITVSLFQAALLVTLTVAGHLVRNVAGQKLIGTSISMIPWVFIFANAVFIHIRL